MPSLRFVTFLAPSMQPVYQAIADHIGRALGCSIEFSVGSLDYREVGEADICFICGLPYVLYTHATSIPFEAMSAPVLVGERYQNQPIYFSDVIVRQESPFQQFEDLRGHSWAYNEVQSQSGYNLTRYEMVKRGETNGFFSQVIHAGYHQKSIRMVAGGEADAAAIDSHVLSLELQHFPELAKQVRVIETFGPSPIQPITAGSHLSPQIVTALQQIFAVMHLDPLLKPHLEAGQIDHFVPVSDADYDAIRQMVAACEAANFLTLR